MAAAGDNLWTTPTNWSGDAEPTTSNDVTINTGARVVLNNTGNCASLILGGGGNADTLIVQSGNTLNVNGAVTINSADRFELAGTAMLYIQGNWSNSGTFVENSSTVVFSGATDATIDNNTTAQADTFYNVSLNKTSTDNALSNTAGAGGTHILISGNLAINDGEFVVNEVTAGTGADLRVTGDLTLAQAGEGLNISAANVEVEFDGQVNINDTDTHAITPGTSSKIFLNGSGSQTWGGSNTTGETVVDIVVNKSSGTVTFERPVVLTEDFVVQNGTAEFSSPATLTLGDAATDSLTVRSGGTFRINAGATLNMYAAATGGIIDVLSGGTIEILGSSRTNRAAITRQGGSGTYVFNVAGTIRAKYGDFSYGNTAGVNLIAGATLHATDNFDFSRF